MKKRLAIFLLTCTLFVIACNSPNDDYQGGDGEVLSDTPLYIEANGEDGLTGSASVEEQENKQNDGKDDIYSVEQIQKALEKGGAFNLGDFGEGNPQVVYVEKVERDRDSIYHEGAGLTYDLSNSERYKVEIRYRQSIEEFNVWEEFYKDFEFSPFRRDGDYTILTEYYYFNDVDGEPELAFISC